MNTNKLFRWRLYAEKIMINDRYVHNAMDHRGQNNYYNNHKIIKLPIHDQTKDDS